MAQRDLFGGTIVAQFPMGLIDASDLRQVPDNQEVFLYPDCNVSIIIEVLQRVPNLTDMDAAKFHFEALAHDNGAISSTMQKPIVPNDRGVQTPSPITLCGSQCIPKTNAATGDDVDILLALFRVCSSGKSADIVVSTNIPRGDVVQGRAAAIASEFQTLVSSLTIINYGLFC